MLFKSGPANEWTKTPFLFLPLLCDLTASNECEWLDRSEERKLRSFHSIECRMSGQVRWVGHGMKLVPNEMGWGVVLRFRPFL